MEIHDRTVIEVASWRLASELMRRHPDDARLIRGHPGGGQYDVLWILGLDSSNLNIPLNRNGTIQIHGRADKADLIEWEPTSWIDYLAADPRIFVEQLERAAGWPSPTQVPASTPITLTYRTLASIAGFGFKTVHPIDIEEGYIDTSGYGGGASQLLAEFSIPSELTDVRPDDFYGEPGYRFWIPRREGKSICAIEQTSGTAWFHNRKDPLVLSDEYRSCKKEMALVAARILSVSLSLE